MKRMLIGTLLALVGFSIFGLGDRLLAQRAPASEPLCALPRKGTFSVGWVAEEGGKHYRCLPIFDSNLQPAGVAWVEVTRSF